MQKRVVRFFKEYEFSTEYSSTRKLIFRKVAKRKTQGKQKSIDLKFCHMQLGIRRRQAFASFCQLQTYCSSLSHSFRQVAIFLIFAEMETSNIFFFEIQVGRLKHFYPSLDLRLTKISIEAVKAQYLVQSSANIC